MLFLKITFVRFGREMKRRARKIAYGIQKNDHQNCALNYLLGQEGKLEGTRSLGPVSERPKIKIEKALSMNWTYLRIVGRRKEY
jgi:hypothetical protein